MNDECNIEEVVTHFLLNTCRLRPRLSLLAAQAALRCAQVATVQADDDDEVDLIPLATGSFAEFYIEPMLPHIGDVDVMFSCSTDLAIPRGYTPPTQLPAEFHNYVRVMDIIGSHLPGYVYLKIRYLLTECVEDGKYNAVEYDRQRQFYASNCEDCEGGDGIHGPAMLTDQIGALVPTDIVRCIRCLVWPPQAADWPTRHRNYGWPDSAIVHRVVSNGCDVVGAVHRQCRQHEEMSQYQWRLSFSRAEILLMNSWMPVQQILYHMLRIFVKTERLSADNSGAGTLSNYHIKTLMLWACELQSRNWWTEDLNLVRICVQLLHTLGDWLTDERCQHYFISNCNLIDNPFNIANVGGQLMSIDATWLSMWFVDNYIRKCSELCPYNISGLFNDVSRCSTSMTLLDAVSAVITWRISNPLELCNRLFAFDLLCHQITGCVYKTHLTARSCACWMTELEKIDSCLAVYFRAVTFLHVAYKSSRQGLDGELIDVLATLFGQFITKRHYSNNSTSLLSLGQAAKLMKVAANKPLSTMSLIAIELSKAYLYRALSCKDSDSDSIYCLANVYLAVLYYITGQYQTAIDHCTLVMRSQDHSQCSSHVVQRELLPKIDHNVDSMLGLAVFYQHVRATALNQQYPAQYVSVLTTELLAYYLRIINFLSLTMCPQFEHTSLTEEFKRYKIHISDIEQLYIGDVLLFVLSNRWLKETFDKKPVCQQSAQPKNNLSDHNSLEMVQLLRKSAIESLTSSREIKARVFASVVTIVTTDFEALYAYKRGDYQRCLQVCTQNVHTLLYTVQVYLLDVPTFPEFIQLLDDDIVSLTALTVIINPECREHARYVSISQLTLSLYLMTQCQLKLRHSVTSLTQTLDYIKVARDRHRVTWTLDRLVLKMTAHKALMHISTTTN